jgi:hypothetical protein
MNGDRRRPLGGPSSMGQDDVTGADARRAADDPIAVRLEQLAAQLAVPKDDLARIETVVVARFRESIGAETRSAPRLRVRPGWFRFRTALAVGLAAVLVLLSVAAVGAASGPGQPFYHVRLAVEDLTLPPPGSPDRLSAQVRLLAARLAETQAAAEQGNAGAVADAADAYAQRVQSAVGDFLAQRAPGTLADVLQTQQTELQVIAAQAPTAAGPAVAGASAAVVAAQDALAIPLPTPCPSTAPAVTSSGGLVPSVVPPSAAPSDSLNPLLPGRTATSGCAPASVAPIPSTTVAPTERPSPTPTPAPTPTPRPTVTPTPTPTPSPTETPSPSPVPTPSPATPQPSQPVVDSEAPSTAPSESAPPLSTDAASGAPTGSRAEKNRDPRPAKSVHVAAVEQGRVKPPAHRGPPADRRCTADPPGHATHRSVASMSHPGDSRGPASHADPPKDQRGQVVCA